MWDVLGSLLCLLGNYNLVVLQVRKNGITGFDLFFDNHFADAVFEVLLDGFVGWGEDGVVSASREELADGRIAYLRHSRLAEQPEVFAVLLVFVFKSSMRL